MRFSVSTPISSRIGQTYAFIPGSKATNETKPTNSSSTVASNSAESKHTGKISCGLGCRSKCRWIKSSSVKISRQTRSSTSPQQTPWLSPSRTPAIHTGRSNTKSPKFMAEAPVKNWNRATRSKLLGAKASRKGVRGWLIWSGVG